MSKPTHHTKRSSTMDTYIFTVENKITGSLHSHRVTGKPRAIAFIKNPYNRGLDDAQILHNRVRHKKQTTTLTQTTIHKILNKGA